MTTCALCRREPTVKNPLFEIRLVAPAESEPRRVCYACLDEVSPPIMFVHNPYKEQS